MDSGPLIRTGGQAIAEGVSTPAPGYYSYGSLPNQDSWLRDYFRILMKRKWVALITLAVIFGAVTIATLRSTRFYEAVGSIAINKSDPVPINFKDSAGPSEDYYDPTDLDTEIRILRSDLLALQVIRQLNLDKPSGNAAKSGSLPLTTDAFDSNSLQTSAALGEFKGNLRVSLVPNTRVIEIGYRSPDKNLAARVVNTLASTYVEQNFKTRFESTMQASDWLSKQLVDLQMKVESSQEKLVQFKKAHNILGVDEKQNLTTVKLDELNRDLTSAESYRMDKESVYRLVQSGDPDAVIAASSSLNNAGSAAGGQSSMLEKLRGQQSELKMQAAQLGTQFGPAYPKVAQLNNQIKEIDSQIVAEMKKTVARLHGDYMAALQRENMLRAALDKQKQEANDLNESAIQYNLLKRDVDVAARSMKACWKN